MKNTVAVKFVASLCFLCSVIFPSFAIVEFKMDSVTGLPSSQVTIQVRAYDFSQILSIQGTIQFDTSVVAYNTVQNFGLPVFSIGDFGTTQTSSGKLTYSWYDLNLTGVTLPDSTIIFEIVLDVTGTNGQQSGICFVNTPTLLEVIDTTFAAVNANYVCGRVLIPGGANPVGTVVATNIRCNGEDSGSISVSVSGGSSPYTYEWSNGDTTATISGLSSGSYTVTITDANNLHDTLIATIAEPPLLMAAITPTGTSSCSATDGSAIVSVSGGITPYSYLWSNGASTPIATGLSVGNISVSVTDGNNCLAVDSVLVAQPSSVIVTIVSSADVNCFGDADGSAEVVASGGANPYTYAWSNNTFSASAPALAAGTYTVTATDQNSCSAAATVTISQPAQLSVSSSASDVSCFGLSNGSAIVSVTGGKSPYAYLWSNGTLTSTISNQVIGSYSVTITDANNCITSTSVVISQPAALTVSAAITDVSAFGNADGEIDLTVSGGVTPYFYGWSNGSITQDISGLDVGTYSLTVIDLNNCSITSDFVVDGPSSIQQHPQSNEVVLFPNPNDGRFAIAFEENAIGKNTSIEVLNMFGQVVFKTENSTISSKLFLTTNLDEGIYFLRLSTRSFVSPLKIIITN